MIIKVKLNTTTELFDVSKKLQVKELKDMIKERMDVEIDHQRLIFKGKQLSVENSLFDYGVNLNDCIQLWVMKNAPIKHLQDQSIDEDKENKSNNTVTKIESSDEATKTNNEEKGEKSKPAKAVIIEEKDQSEFFKIGDLIDIRDTDDSESAGAYFEGEIVKICVEEGAEAVAGCDGLCYYCKYDAYDGDDYKIKFEQIRPRARKLLKSRELEADMEVMVNYNLQEPDKRGFWFRGKVEQVRPHLLVTLFVGVEQTPVEGCKIVFPDEVFRLENPVKVEERNEKLDREMNTAVARKHPPKCEACMDNPKKKCKECGCAKCGGKNDPDSILICDECQRGYHLKCIGLKTIPEDDEWYCPECKNVDDIVKAGEKQKDGKKMKKMASKANPEGCKRDWGKGFATVGRTKECKIVSKDHFGPIPGVEVGELWMFRVQVSEAGVHRPHVAGIAGTADNGCPSLVLGGGYEDDVDDGEEFTYTGSGGRDLSGNKRTAPQSSDQELTRTNAAIARNCVAKFDDKKGGDAGDKWKQGKPIRVLRGYKGRKHSKYAPEEGCRYDGIYKVVKYWPQKGQSGFLVWRYLLRRDDPVPPPWTKEGKKRIEEGGWGEIQKPENYEETQAKKLADKAAKLSDKENKGDADKKGKKRKNSGEAGDEEVKQKKEKKVTVSKYKVAADLVKAMKEDKPNSKVWKELLEKDYKTRKELVAAVEESFSCVVCMGVVTMPVTLECLHNFCNSCITRGVKAEGAVCPMCRAEIDPKKLEVNEKLRTVLNMVFPGYEKA